MSVVALIPARYASTRLPGKPLLDRTGLPLICHVAARAAAADCISRVIIATDDRRIAQAAETHGYEAAMTRPDHPNGTARIAEVAETLGEEIDCIVNVQGDEPMIEPGLIDAAVERLRGGDEPMATIASPFVEGENPSDPNIVKVVLDRRGRALYFSRSVVPHVRDPQSSPPDARLLKHIGLYAYRRPFLATYIALEPTPAERAEKLEQLRALEHGYPIGVAVRSAAHHGIDTPEQYEQFVQQWRAEPRA